MSDDLVKRLRMVSDMISLGERISWGRDTAIMDEAAAALVAKDAEIARLREALRLALGVAESWIHNELDGTSLLDDELAQLEPARASLIAQNKGGTP